ncbi:alpha/beta hydrolase family protein [Geodermatophilus normandii]|uniref:Alpha/beta hydrolase family protein n=1 Tax=Geodermatophilus normandii TaxID=1137989 RepID=A0A317QIB9_9ACTN|nr:alpha/beta hydrolase [Geodermatophilus normandii]PWW23072.1 alpha/beta hydrolase family protein [Geodermatophilus normandii]
MRNRWGAAFLLLGALWTVAAQPSEAAVPGPVRLDATCAADLAARLGEGTVIGCDPAGRGLAVVVLGDLATAAHVTVLVPGSDVDLARLARPFAWAQALAGAGGPGLAVVVWVGYGTPDGLGVDAAGGRLARAGAAALVRFVDDLRTGAHVTVVGHSYGAVVTALAARHLAADDLVLLGSPGARADSVAGLGTRARVWAGRADDDWIGRVPNVRVGDLGHGADPADPDFGARAVPVDGVAGHDGYLAPGTASLTAVAAVATGRAGAVAA